MKLPKAVLEEFRKLGRIGGQSKSEKKALAAKENGKRGGRPRKKAKKPLDLK